MSKTLPVIDAGDFTSWVAQTLTIQAHGGEADVGCGSCNSCCRSSFFIHIGPEEKRAFAAIPKKLLFKAPGLPVGYWLMGHDDEGKCPMLVDDRCSIYEDRPFTCRQFDCRIFAATDLPVDDDNKALIKAQNERWRFSYATPKGEAEHLAARRAGAFLQEHASEFPGGVLPQNNTQLAMIAVRVHALFLDEASVHDVAARVTLISNTIGR